MRELANLQIIDPIGGDSVPLSADQKDALFSQLNRVEKLTWAKVRKSLGIHDGELINLKEGGANHLQGNKTAHVLIKTLGEPHWDSMTSEDQDRLVTEITNIESEDSLRRRLTEGWHFDESTAEKLLKAKLETGKGKFSHKAISAMLPHLKSGKNLWQSKVACGYEDKQDQGEETLVPEHDDIRNPVVLILIHESRKVVNAIIRVYGKPDVIRIEMARDLKQSKDDKKEYNSAIKKNEAENESVRKILNEEFTEFSSVAPSRDDVVKYRLWKECDMVCPYSGQSISKSMLFSGAVERTHRPVLIVVR